MDWQLFINLFDYCVSHTGPAYTGIWLLYMLNNMNLFLFSSVKQPGRFGTQGTALATPPPTIWLQRPVPLISSWTVTSRALRTTTAPTVSPLPSQSLATARRPRDPVSKAARGAKSKIFGCELLREFCNTNRNVFFPGFLLDTNLSSMPKQRFHMNKILYKRYLVQ